MKMTISEAIQNKSVQEFIMERINSSRATFEKLGDESEKFFKKAQDQVDTFIADDARKTVEDLLDQGRKMLGQIEERINEGIEAGLKKLSIPSMKEFEELKLQVSKLNAEVKKIKKRIPAKAKAAPKTKRAKKAA